MIRIIAEFSIRAGALEDAIKVGTALVQETRKETGCIQYDLLQGKEDKNCLVIVENWASQETLDAHSASAHFAEYVPQLSGFCDTPAKVTHFEQVV